MLRLGKLTDYGIMLLTTLSEDPERVYSATELASATRLEQTTVAKILKTLTRSGLVESFRGARGGYRLADAPERIAVSRVIGAMEGPIGMTECSVSPGSCAQEAFCRVQSNWRIISRAIEGALAGVTLADMARELTPPDISRLRVVTLAR